MSRRSFAILSALLGGALFLLTRPVAPAQAGTVTRGKQIIDNSIQALGGDHFLNMKNRVERGRIYGFFRDQLSGLDVTTTYVEYLPAVPAKGLGIREREVLGKKRDYSYLFLPDQGWDISYRGARPVDDETWSRYERTMENDVLYILKVRHNEPGLQFEYVGSDVLLSTHVEIIDIIDAQDHTVRVYFDHNSFLPVRQTFSWQDPQTREHNDEQTDYDKWRNAGDGIMWPFSIERQRNGYKVYQMFASSIEVNQSVPPNTFDVPASAKILKKGS